VQEFRWGLGCGVTALAASTRHGVVAYAERMKTVRLDRAPHSPNPSCVLAPQPHSLCTRNPCPPLHPYSKPHPHPSQIHPPKVFLLSLDLKQKIATLSLDGDLGVVCIDIARDATRLCILSDVPDHTIVVWDWIEDKVLARTRLAPANRSMHALMTAPGIHCLSHLIVPGIYCLSHQIVPGIYCLSHQIVPGIYCLSHLIVYI
jgi:hypothetical protein